MTGIVKDILKVRRDRLVNNFQFIEVILTSWRVPCELCKLLFLPRHYNIKYDFCHPMKDQNINQKKKAMLYI